MYRSSSWSIVALVRGCRRSATSATSRARISSASRLALGLAGTTSPRLCRRFVTGIDAGVHAHPERAVGQHVDGALRTPRAETSRPVHRRSVARARVTRRVTMRACRKPSGVLPLVKHRAGGRDRTDDLPLTRLRRCNHRTVYPRERCPDPRLTCLRCILAADFRTTFHATAGPELRSWP